MRDNRRPVYSTSMIKTHLGMINDIIMHHILLSNQSALVGPDDFRIKKTCSYYSSTYVTTDKIKAVLYNSVYRSTYLDAEKVLLYGNPGR